MLNSLDLGRLSFTHEFKEQPTFCITQEAACMLATTEDHSISNPENNIKITPPSLLNENFNETKNLKYEIKSEKCHENLKSNVRLTLQIENVNDNLDFAVEQSKFKNKNEIQGFQKCSYLFAHPSKIAMLGKEKVGPTPFLYSTVILDDRWEHLLRTLFNEKSNLCAFRIMPYELKCMNALKGKVKFKKNVLYKTE